MSRCIMAIGIQIEDQHIIVAVLEQRERPILSHLFSIKGESERLASQLSFLFRSHHFDPYRVIISHPTHHAIIRKISLPFIDPRQIDKVISFETEQHIQSRPIEELLVSYHILKIEDKNARLLVAALPIENIENSLSWIESCEIYPFAMDLDIMGLFYIAQLQNFAEQNVLILDIKTDVCNMLALSSGHIQDLRAIRIQIETSEGAQDSTQSPNPLQQGIGRTEFLTLGVKATLFLRLIKEIRRTVFDFHSIYLCGDKDLLAYLPVFLGKRLKIPILPWDISHISIAENVDMEIVPLACPAIGLALKALDQAKGGYNFRQGIFASAKTSELIKKPLLLFVTLLFLFTLFLAIQFHILRREKSRLYLDLISHAEKIFASLKPQASLENVDTWDKISAIKDYVEQSLQQDSKPIPPISDAFLRWAGISEKIIQIRNQYYFTVDSLSIDQKEAILTGRTETSVCFDSFITHFQELPDVTYAKVISCQEIEDTNLTLQYKFLIKFREPLR